MEKVACKTTEHGSELNVFPSLAVKTPNSLSVQWNAEVFLSLMVQFIVVQLEQGTVTLARYFSLKPFPQRCPISFPLVTVLTG